MIQTQQSRTETDATRAPGFEALERLRNHRRKMQTDGGSGQVHDGFAEVFAGIAASRPTPIEQPTPPSAPPPRRESAAERPGRTEASTPPPAGTSESSSGPQNQKQGIDRRFSPNQTSNAKSNSVPETTNASADVTAEAESASTDTVKSATLYDPDWQAESEIEAGKGPQRVAPKNAPMDAEQSAEVPGARDQIRTPKEVSDEAGQNPVADGSLSATTGGEESAAAENASRRTDVQSQQIAEADSSSIESTSKLSPTEWSNEESHSRSADSQSDSDRRESGSENNRSQTAEDKSASANTKPTNAANPTAPPLVTASSAAAAAAGSAATGSAAAVANVSSSRRAAVAGAAVNGTASAASRSGAGLSNPAGLSNTAIGAANARNATSGGAVKRPTATEGTDTSDIVSRVKLVQRVTKAFEHLGRDGGRVRMRLAPEALGSIQIDMTVKGRSVEAYVVAENEAAAAMLREHLPELRTRLESFGLEVQSFEVETESSAGFQQQSSSQSSSADDSPNQQRSRQLTAESAQSASDKPTDVGEPVVAQRTATGGVDLIA